MKILAVDDDPVFAELLVETLKQAGYAKITSVSSGDEALLDIELSDTPYDCFLLDITMPEMDGIALCSAIRALPAYRLVPILMVTAMAEKIHMDRAFAAGASDYISKPINGLELGSRMRVAEALSAALAREREAKAALERAFAGLGLNWGEGFARRIGLDLPQAIELPALQNYLRQLPAGLYNMQVTGYLLEEAAELHQRLTAAEFEQLIGKVATAIAGVWQGSRVFLAYLGSGRFVTLSETRNRASAEALQAAISARLEVEVSARRLSRGICAPERLLADLTRAMTPAEAPRPAAPLPREPEIETSLASNVLILRAVERVNKPRLDVESVVQQFCRSDYG